MRQDREKPATELTAPHKALMHIIDELDFVAVAEYPVGKYIVDCYLPEFHVGIEADGPTHSKSKDARRSKYLFDNYSLPILHLSIAVIAQQPAYVRQTILEFAHDFEDSSDDRLDAAEKYERGLNA